MSAPSLPPRPDYTRAARELLDDLEPHLPEKRMIFLTGSAAAGQADRFSSLDLLLLTPQQYAEAARDRLKDRPRQWRIGERELVVRFEVESLEPFEAALQRFDDRALAVLRQGICLEDGIGSSAGLLDRARSVPDEVWREKAWTEFQLMRKRQASIAWSLRRGQPFQVLDGITRFLTHALRLTVYLEGEVPPNRKWLFEAALRTRVGKRIRPSLFLLFSSLDQLAMLGGSRSLRENRIYRELADIHAQAEASLTETEGG